MPSYKSTQVSPPLHLSSSPLLHLTRRSPLRDIHGFVTCPSERPNFSLIVLKLHPKRRKREGVCRGATTLTSSLLETPNDTDEWETSRAR
ncbi:hypothetical protein E2C01_051902 [Portunus trituberculatus]|uniref:Uncharacterized protein n=1 Tax=Portunus trituberculatus TaxID=210409 RepID=A0A5B7GD13_PORTR|nr:hypothetical protein [Portunus trituberculatus]